MPQTLSQSKISTHLPARQRDLRISEGLPLPHGQDYDHKPGPRHFTGGGRVLQEPHQGREERAHRPGDVREGFEGIVINSWYGGVDVLGTRKGIAFRNCAVVKKMYYFGTTRAVHRPRRPRPPPRAEKAPRSGTSSTPRPPPPASRCDPRAEVDGLRLDRHLRLPGVRRGDRSPPTTAAPAVAGGPVGRRRRGGGLARRSVALARRRRGPAVAHRPARCLKAASAETVRLEAGAMDGVHLEDTGVPDAQPRRNGLHVGVAHGCPLVPVAHAHPGSLAAELTTMAETRRSYWSRSATT